MGRLLAALTLALVAATALVARPALERFRVDASTDSLVLEDDPDARRYDRTRLLFGSDEFVLVGLRRPDLFTPDGVAAVASLHQRFAAIEGVRDVLSIANAPLLRSFERPVMPFMALMRQATALTPGVDLEKARAELTGHALFAGNLVNAEGDTAGLIVTLVARPDIVEAASAWVGHQAAVAAAEEATRGGDPAARARLDEAVRAREAFRPTYADAERRRKAERIQVIREVRRVVQEERAAGHDVEVSGVPSIVVEMVEAIDRDLRTFTLLSLSFIVGFLGLVFRRLRWVLLPLVPTTLTVLLTLALMDALGKQVSVITANIPSLLMVIGLAHSIHLIVRWREDQALAPDAPAQARASRVARRLVLPCLFTATTTMVGFLALAFTGSRPIIDFGRFMAFGVALAFLLSFVALPGAMSVLPQRREGRLERSASLLQGLAALALRRKPVVAALALLLAVAGGLGVARLDVEARFIDYFSRGSQIHQGLTYVDEHLGGTSGLEVVLTGPPGAFGPAHPEHLDQAAAVEAWLRERGEVGVVMSYTGLIDEMRKLIQRDRKDAITVLARLPEEAVGRLLSPYVVVQPLELEGAVVEPFSTVRIVARVRETDPALRRIPLLQELRRELEGRFPAQGALRAEATGMFVLYANMLESLMSSQVSSSALCLGAIWVMLALLFRSPAAGLLALVPNLLPITLALGAMGWGGVPLDMATVMIASVSLGIGIDCAIHYLFRYEEELRKDGDVPAALVRTSGSIGTSILYTSLTSVVGFSVLAFSEFRPNAYFGVLTGLAMIAALFGMLTLLPVLVAWTGLFRRRAAPAGAADAEGATLPA
ncbi:MAG: MMPL family transporter [Planctomycetes bacterium]|nr:MMPL family transporter [Planctomycetota bacterium]